MFADPGLIERIVSKPCRVAIVGLSPKPDRDSNKVAVYLMKYGFEIVPVNPIVDSVLGQTSYHSILDIPGNVDVVDVFRKSDAVPVIADQTMQIGAPTLWLQLGVIHEPSATKAMESGMEVVMDRCIKIEHEKWRNRQNQ